MAAYDTDCWWTYKRDFFAIFDTTVQAALNSGPNVYIILDVVRVTDHTIKQYYSC